MSDDKPEVEVFTVPWLTEQIIGYFAAILMAFEDIHWSLPDAEMELENDHVKVYIQGKEVGRVLFMRGNRILSDEEVAKQVTGIAEKVQREAKKE